MSTNAGFSFVIKDIIVEVNSEEWNVLDIPSQFICNGTHCEIHFKYSIFSVY